MTKYLAITRQTANWFINHKDYLLSFAKVIKALSQENLLSEGVIVAGPLRITSHANQIISVWNNDYVTGTDYEDWGFIKLSEPLGLLDQPQIIEEVLERLFYVINQRLQNLYLPEGLNYRLRKTNLFTCSAGRGEAWHFSLGCYENNVLTSKGSLHSIVCIGPSDIPGFELIEKLTSEAGNSLPKLIEISNQLLIKAKSRPALDTPILKGFKENFTSEILKKGSDELEVQSVPELNDISGDGEVRYLTLEYTYEDWIKPESSLSTAQREILESDVLLKQPLRIIGAAGTGKSLLMQLLVMRRLMTSKNNKEYLNILYIVHNREMISAATERFKILGAEEFLLEDSLQKLNITTLFEHCCNELKIDKSTIIDRDAQQTKLAQRYTVLEYIDKVFDENSNIIDNSELLERIRSNEELRDTFSDLIVGEIGVAIKGRGLTSDKKKYIEAERPLTRFHGVLTIEERNIIFDIFEEYKKWFEERGILDSDDIALSLMGHLRTPLWEMKRRKEGFDFVFVDETQLFNENERMLFKFLPKKSLGGHLPIAFALDEAQESRGTTNIGFGLLGIDDIFNETLPSVYRCSSAILNLAFFIISRTTDLFGPDFPDFTKSTTTLVSKNDARSEKPKLIINPETKSFEKSILKEIRNLRKNNFRQIAIVIHTERYWQEILTLLKNEDLPVIEATKRGELLDPKKPVIYVARPDIIGGQEFDAVICVGLEHGVVPPIVNGHPGLSETLEQQSLREMYLAFTRARYQLLIINSKNSSPSPIIQHAIEEGLIGISQIKPPSRV